MQNVGLCAKSLNMNSARFCTLLTAKLVSRNSDFILLKINFRNDYFPLRFWDPERHIWHFLNWFFYKWSWLPSMEYNYIPSKSAFSSMECFLLLKIVLQLAWSTFHCNWSTFLYCMGVHTVWSTFSSSSPISIQLLSVQGLYGQNNTIKSALPVPSVLVRRFSRWVSVE